MGVEVLIHERLFTPDRFFPQCHASTLVVLQGEEILAAWFAGTKEGQDDVAIWCARRKDGVWQDPFVAADEPDVPCWNPVLFAGEDGALFLYYKAGKTTAGWSTKVAVSHDNGYTWSQSQELVPGDKGGRGPVKNKIIRLSDGTWAAPASLEGETYWDCFVDLSGDQGKTWTARMVPFAKEGLKGPGIIQPTLWESAPGHVHMLARSSEGCLYRSDSQDYGHTWSPVYPSPLPNNNSGVDAVRLDNGDVALVYNPVSGNWAGRSPIVCSVSKDNGHTWDEGFVLDHNAQPADFWDGEFSYPAIVAQGSDIYVTYTWKRKTIAFRKLRLT